MQGRSASADRVMLVEDHHDFRLLMTDVLGQQHDLEVVGQAGSLSEARSHAATTRFDVAALDLSLPYGNGTELIGDLQEVNADVAVLVLSAGFDHKTLCRATEAGADKIMDKLASFDEIIESIRRLRTREVPDRL